MMSKCAYSPSRIRYNLHEQKALPVSNTSRTLFGGQDWTVQSLMPFLKFGLEHRQTGSLAVQPLTLVSMLVIQNC